MRIKIQRLLFLATPALLLAVGGCDRIFGAGDRIAGTCRVMLTVKDDHNQKTQHLKLGHKIRLVGPLGPEEDYRVRPFGNAPAHLWQIQNYDAINISLSSPPTEFELWVDVVSPGQHPVVSPHGYTMTLEYHEDGCPSKAVFEAAVDLDSDGTTDHGGHVDALR